MMKKVLFVALLLFASCNKRPLEVESLFDIPEEKAIRNINDLEVLVNGGYQSLQSKLAYGASMKLIPDLVSDQIVITPRAYERNTGDYFTLYTRQFFGVADGLWREAYVCINRANAVLDAIDKKLVVPASQTESDNIDRIQGEAYFLRALMHFELVRLWSLQYGLNQNEPNSGVILKLTPTRGRYQQPRATTEEVYNSIESDLKKAINLLPEDRRATDSRTYGGRAGGRATKVAAQAILARVYFQKATAKDDLLAKEIINQIMSNSDYAVTNDNFSDNGIDFLIKSNYEVSNSVFFQVVNILNPFTNEGNSTVKPFLDSYYPEEAENGNQQFPTIYSLSTIFTDSIINRTFRERASADRRFSKGTQGTSPRYTTKYKSPASSVNLNVPVIRAGELVISRAEINASLGLRQEAIDDIIALRSRAYDPSVIDVGSAVAADRLRLESLTDRDLLLEINRERSRELFTEGDRLHHFRRFNQRHGFNLKMGTDKSSYRLESNITFDNKRFLFQIPDAEIAANPAATRN